VDALLDTSSLIILVLAGLGVGGVLAVLRRRRTSAAAPPEVAPAPGGAAPAAPAAPAVPSAPTGPAAPAAPPATTVAGVGARLARTRTLLGSALAELVGAGLDDASWERLAEALIGADVGVEATTGIVEDVRRASRERGVHDLAGVRELLRAALVAELSSGDRDLAHRPTDGAGVAGGPTVWLVTGVNGAGKTTTIGKLAAREVAAGRRVVLAAADTFRAAAADQLAVWAERTGAELVRGADGADPASVAYAALDVASSSGADLCIVDTAGRLQNRRELMDELGKVARVIEKRAGHIDESLLVLDGTAGQNALTQAEAFLAAVGVTGIALTKLDGASRGGIVVAVQRRLGIPVKLVGLGEGVDDLATFDPEVFVGGLLAD
jgi:fused signal recognition particle receptor